MNPEIKQQWINALRSGKYKQGIARLARYRDDGEIEYCCLGVLCDLSPVEREENKCCNECAIEIKWDEDVTSLPTSVSKWAGIMSNDGDININVDDKDAAMLIAAGAAIGTNNSTCFAALNDNGIPFSIIADMIEKYV